MKVIDPGHMYDLRCLDVDGHIRLTFVKRDYPAWKFPGNDGSYPGTTTQEVMRALIDRAKYVNSQIPHPANQVVIDNLRNSIRELERRAAENHKRELRWNEIREDIENEPTCNQCGHIQCNGLCRAAARTKEE